MGQSTTFVILGNLPKSKGNPLKNREKGSQNNLGRGVTEEGFKITIMTWEIEENNVLINNEKA